MSLKICNYFENMKIVEFFLIIWGKMVRVGAGAGIFDKLEPELEPDKNGTAPQHCLVSSTYLYYHIWLV
jgi:hypothetical protein